MVYCRTKKWAYMGIGLVADCQEAALSFSNVLYGLVSLLSYSSVGYMQL
jgi:hypothetical protein